MDEERPAAGRMFNSIATAEEAYRLQQQNIDTLVLKIDGLADLVKTLATAITTLVSHSTEPPKRAPSPTVSAAGSRAPQDDDDVTSQLPERRQYMDRDRSTEPPADDDEDTPSSAPNYKGISGVKLPKFHGEYTEDVNAWISIIEDQFTLNRTPKKSKVVAVSALLKDDALTLYIWLKNQYQRPLTWTEFKRELQVKFAESTVRTAALRDKLQSIPYDGPATMEKYVSKFRSLESQIPVKEMAFGDRLHYFIAPLELDLRRFIKRDNPHTMELAYDAAVDWAFINKELPKVKSNGDIFAEPEQNKESDVSDDDLDVLDAKQLAQVTCYKCGKRGHFSRGCTSPQTSRNYKAKAKALYNVEGIHRDKIRVMDKSDSESEGSSDSSEVADIEAVPLEGGGFRLKRKEA